jgi:hypothetical protein
MDIEVNVPDGKSGSWSVETFEVTQKDADFENLRAMFGGGRHIKVGKFKRLMHGRTVVMSNTPAEIKDHMGFIFKAQKAENVLINGLGLGVALVEILKSDIVKRVDVVEISEDVIKLVAPTFAHDKRVNIIHADAMTYKPQKGIKYGASWHDIWSDICSDNLPAMKKLHRRYGRCSEWQGSWCRWLCENGRLR